MLRSCALVFLVVSSCSCPGTGPTGARFRITSQGEGPTNQLPLNPLRVGAVLGDALATQIIDGVIDTPNGRELRLTKTFGGFVTRVSQSTDGLFFTASTVDGTNVTPVLVVPTTVRVGMAWDVFTQSDEKPLYHFEVKERAELAETFFGPAVQWRIESTDDQGAVVSRRYLEGRGNVEALAQVMWNEEPQVAAESAPAVELEPLEVPASFGKRGWVEALSLVRIGEGPGLFIANDEAYDVGGTIGWCATYAGGSSALTPVTPSPGSPFRRTAGLECVTTQLCAKVTSSVGIGTLDCSISIASGHASGAFVGSDGQVTWAPRTNTGALAYADMVRTGSDFSEVSYRGYAVVPDAQGRGALLYTHFAGYQDLLALGDATRLFGDPAAPDLVTNNTLALTDLQRVTPLSDDTGGRTMLLLQTSDGMLWTAKLEGRALSRPTRHVRLAGLLSVQATERGHEVLRVTGDGLVQRLRVDEQGLGLDPIAQLKLAPTDLAHSAFLFREGGQTFLVVAVQQPDGRDVRGPLVKLSFFRSKQPVTPQPTVRPARALGVYARTAGPNNDTLVCWRGGVLASRDGWTVGGAPAMGVAPVDFGGPCALVLRPGGSPFTGETVNGSPYWTTEGPVPEQPRVTVRTGIATNLGFRASMPLPVLLAPLKEGGFVTGRRLYGPGGVVLGMPRFALDAEISAANAQLFAIDAAGHGLWMSTRDPMAPTVGVVRRLGSTPLEVRFSAGTAIATGFPAQGGGVVLPVNESQGPRYLFLAPDGGTTDLQTDVVTERVSGRLANGTFCGEVLGQRRAWCRKPDGTTVTAPLPADLGSLPVPSAFLPTDDGVFLTALGDHWAFDPATATFIDRPAGALTVTSMAHAADGSVWGVVFDSARGFFPARLRKTGIEEVPVPAGIYQRGEDLARVVPDQGVLLVSARNQHNALIARPP